MLLMRTFVNCVLAILVPASVCGQTGSRVTFQDAASEIRFDQREEEHHNERLEGRQGSNGTRQGKDFLDWIGFGTGRNVDPFVARTNSACLEGDLAECFKSRALTAFSDFFDQSEYSLNDNVRVVRMSKDIVQDVSRQSYEFSSTPRAEESEWDQLVKFAARKVEKFIKTAAVEVSVPSWLTGENEVYAPRFLDEIADEIDTIENKKDTLFSRHRLRKLFIPMLIILKLFKLKLLLFLPLILGLASFKKFLGFLAIVIPGLIAFFKLCKPQIQTYQPPVYSQSGIGFPHYKENANGHHTNEGHYHNNEGGYHNNEYHGSYDRDSVSFGQDLAYQGYRDYQA